MVDMVFVRHGDCNRCGLCCRLISLVGLNRTVALNRMLGKNCFATQCGWLETKKDGTTVCRNYANRPTFCKNFPAEPEDISSLREKCGYWFEDEKQ